MQTALFQGKPSYTIWMISNDRWLQKTNDQY